MEPQFLLQILFVFVSFCQFLTEESHESRISLAVSFWFLPGRPQTSFIFRTFSVEDELTFHRLLLTK